MELHKIVDNVKSDGEVEIALDKNNGCLKEVLTMENKVCDFNNQIDMDVPIINMHDSFIDVFLLLVI